MGTTDILTALKVMGVEDWEDVASADEDDSTYWEAGPPVTQATLSQPSPIQTPIPNSSTMSRRQSEVQTGLVRIAMPTTQSYWMAPHFTNYSASGFPSQAFPAQPPLPSDDYLLSAEINTGSYQALGATMASPSSDPSQMAPPLMSMSASGSRNDGFTTLPSRYLDGSMGFTVDRPDDASGADDVFSEG